MNKSGRFEWPSHVAWKKQEIRTKFWLGNLKGRRDCLGDLHVGWG